MLIKFRRVTERSYTTTVLREDGLCLEIAGPDRPKTIPHDLAHLIVERMLHLPGRFWGRVARGAVFPSMRVVTGRQPFHAAKRSRQAGKDGDQLGTQAEVLVSALVEIAMHDGDGDWMAAQALLRSLWLPPRAVPILWDADKLRTVCQELGGAANDWQDLMVGDSLSVLVKQHEFHPSAPIR